MAAMEYLQRAGLAVEVIGGNLRLSPADRITDAVRVFVHNHKPALLAEAKAYRQGAAGAAWWRCVLFELRCTKAHLLSCGVVDDADITPKELGEYVALGTTPKAFAVALRRCERWRPS